MQNCQLMVETFTGNIRFCSSTCMAFQPVVYVTGMWHNMVPTAWQCAQPVSELQYILYTSIYTLLIMCPLLYSYTHNWKLCAHLKTMHIVYTLLPRKPRLSRPELSYLGMVYILYIPHFQKISLSHIIHTLQMWYIYITCMMEWINEEQYHSD